MDQSTEHRELCRAIVETLRQGEALLAGLADEAYTQKHPLAYQASIGGHYRHCLDHFRSLLEAAPFGSLNYDRRERGTSVETDRAAALELTRELIAGWEDLDAEFVLRGLQVTCKTSYTTSGSQMAQSTVGREIMYVVAHAVHHYAIIGVMAGVGGLQLPAGFGIAPSTLKHQQQAVASA
jgi:uncharacterized damage-inducible protein DinB